MFRKLPLIPEIRVRTDKVYKFSEKAKICGTCNLPTSKCSYRCKRYKEELLKLEQSKSNGKGND